MKPRREAARGADDASTAREWKQHVLAELFASTRVSHQALMMAQNSRALGDPEVVFSDLHAARAYLRTCVMRMGVAEVEGLSDLAAASLWARGTLGAARYRAARAQRGSHLRGPSRGEPEE